MGNSIPNYNVFGKMAGISASEYAKKTKISKLTLDHVKIGKRRWKEKEQQSIEKPRFSYQNISEKSPLKIKKLLIIIS